jgi:hypothetical protein
VQPPRHDHQVGKAQHLRSWCNLATAFQGILPRQKPGNTSVFHSRLFSHLRASAAWGAPDNRRRATALYCCHTRTRICHPYRTLVRRALWRGPSGALFRASGQKILGSSSMSTSNENNQANRAISTGKLHALPHFHTRPINVVVFHGSDREHSFSGWFPA